LGGGAGESEGIAVDCIEGTGDGSLTGAEAGTESGEQEFNVLDTTVSLATSDRIPFGGGKGVSPWPLIFGVISLFAVTASSFTMSPLVLSDRPELPFVKESFGL